MNSLIFCFSYRKSVLLVSTTVTLRTSLSVASVYQKIYSAQVRLCNGTIMYATRVHVPVHTGWHIKWCVI